MDPNETLKWIDNFIAKGLQGQEVDDCCEDLYNWVKEGGYEPNWNRYPLGASYYRCRTVHHKRR